MVSFYWLDLTTSRSVCAYMLQKSANRAVRREQRQSLDGWKVLLSAVSRMFALILSRLSVDMSEGFGCNHCVRMKPES